MEKETDVRERKPVLAFDHSFKVEVYEPDFEPLSSVDSLDVKKLAAKDQKIEIGHMEGACCRLLVYAVIKNGMVVSIETEKCDGPKEDVPEEIKLLFSSVAKKLNLSDRWEPVPVQDVAAMVRRIRVGGGTNCIWICVWNTCFVCCNNPFDCFFMDGKKSTLLKA